MDLANTINTFLSTMFGALAEFLNGLFGWLGQLFSGLHFNFPA